ncbi:MAG: protein rep [candidate division WOR-3 bacterium]|nr:protein rep [candidate division WOR-3 bacterium]
MVGLDYKTFSEIVERLRRCEDVKFEYVDVDRVNENLKTCESVFYKYKCEDCGQVYVIPVRCSYRVCVKCAKKRAMKWYKRLENFVMAWKWPIFLTLTYRWVREERLRVEIKALKKAFRKLLRKLKIDKKSKGIYSIEKVIKGGGWVYLHLHALLDYIWLDGEEVERVWKEITGAYIKRIKRVRMAERKEALREVIKYILKGIEDLSIEDKIFYNIVLKNMRMVEKWGFSV